MASGKGGRVRSQHRKKKLWGKEKHRWYGNPGGKTDLVKGIARVKEEFHHSTERRSWGKREPRNQKGETSLVKGFSKGRGRATLPYRMEKLGRKEKQRARRKRIQTIDIEKMEELGAGVKKGKAKAE